MLARSLVFQWSEPLENLTKWRPFFQLNQTKHQWETEQTPTKLRRKNIQYSGSNSRSNSGLIFYLTSSRIPVIYDLALTRRQISGRDPASLRWNLTPTVPNVFGIPSPTVYLEDFTSLWFFSTARPHLLRTPGVNPIKVRYTKFPLKCEYTLGRILRS